MVGSSPTTLDRNSASGPNLAARMASRVRIERLRHAVIAMTRSGFLRPAWMAGRSNPRATSGLWVATFWSGGTDAGPTANASGTVGHRRFDRQRKKVANSSGLVMVQAASGRMAPAFGRERRESIQKSFEGGKATRIWHYSERTLVCGQAVCPACRHRESCAPLHRKQTEPASRG